jgi:hypothetical protein
MDKGLFIKDLTKELGAVLDTELIQPSILGVEGSSSKMFFQVTILFQYSY